MLDDLGVPVNRRKLTGHHHDVADVLRTFVRSLCQAGPAEKSRDARPTASCEPGTIRARRLAAVKSNVASTRNLPAISPIKGTAAWRHRDQASPPEPLHGLTGQVILLRVDAATAQGLDGTLVGQSIGL